MKQKNSELIAKFETMCRWMLEDTYRSMFKAKANLLVAQTLLNYTETIGSFIDPSGGPGERFDAFFSRMGQEYVRLLHRFNGKRRIRPHIIYDDLRCGLTHEYAVKRKKFIIYNHGGENELNDTEINRLAININGTNIRCTAGILHSWEHKKGVWHFVDPKYWLDFKNALELYISDIKNPKNRVLRVSFFSRARKINFIEFKV